MAKAGPSQNEGELIAQLMSYRNDPEGFALFAFPWGQKNTPLAQMDGPRQWQRDMFAKIADHLLLDEEKMRIGLPPSPLYIAVSSGRGVGKSAWLSMIDLWVMSCWLGATGIVTANTETQLRSRTMAELGKWHTMSINRHWFDKSTTSLRPQKWFAEVIENKLSIDSQYYYIDAQSWSMENPDAFAGAHSQIGMMLQMDEASGVADSIWSVSEGFFTDLAPLRLWLTISNPRRSSGKFYDCFHKEREYWSVANVDSRTVEGVDKTVYDRIAAKYGEDHDVTRVEVKGEFPRTGSQQFIDSVTVDDAMTRSIEVDAGAPLVMGVDVARFGEDRSVIAFRQGRDARSIPHQVYHRIDTHELARHVAAAAIKHNPAAIFVDGGGVGGGVVDTLRAMRFKIIEVQAGASPDDKNKYRSKRVEMWDRFKEWLDIGSIPNDRDLADDLKGPQYSWHPTTGQLMIESKDEMKKRGIRSPDIAEALLQTFARPVARIDMRTGFRKESRIANDLDYKVFG